MIPDGLIVAIAASEDLYVIDWSVASIGKTIGDNVIVSPTCNSSLKSCNSISVTAIVVSGSSVILDTSKLKLSLISPHETVIVVEPSAIADILPIPLTLATSRSLEAYDKVWSSASIGMTVIFNSCVSPTIISLR